VSDAYRCIIKSEAKNYFVGMDYNGNKYKIIKNEHIKCKIGDDFYFYANRKKGFLKDILTPISDEMAGVKSKLK